MMTSPTTCHPSSARDLTKETLITRVYDNTKQKELAVKVHQTTRTREYYPVFELTRVDKPHRVLGEIDVKPTGWYTKDGRIVKVYVNYMHSMETSDNRSTKEKRYRNVGRALHEFAIRTSFQTGHNGIVFLSPAWSSDGFHFKCGYRYEHPKLERYKGTIHKRTKQFSTMIERYLKEPSEILAEKIIHHESYEYLADDAKKELQRDPENLDEVIEYGYYYNLNTDMERAIYHPEDPRVSEYDKTRRVWNYGYNMVLDPKVRDEWKNKLKI